MLRVSRQRQTRLFATVNVRTIVGKSREFVEMLVRVSQCAVYRKCSTWERDVEFLALERRSTSSSGVVEGREWGGWSGTGCRGRPIRRCDRSEENVIKNRESRHSLRKQNKEYLFSICATGMNSEEGKRDLLENVR